MSFWVIPGFKFYQKNPVLSRGANLCRFGKETMFSKWTNPGFELMTSESWVSSYNCYQTWTRCHKLWSSLGGDEGCIGLSSKLLWLWQTRNSLCRTCITTFHTSLTVWPFTHLHLLKSSIHKPISTKVAMIKQLQLVQTSHTQQSMTAIYFRVALFPSTTRL